MSADRNLNPAENDIMVSLVDAVTRVDDHRETFLNATPDNAQKLVDILQKVLLLFVLVKHYISFPTHSI
jgi:hypothetical protein